MIRTAVQFPGGRRAAVVASAALAVGLVAVVAPSPVTVEASAAGVATAGVPSTALAGTVTAAGAAAVVRSTAPASAGTASAAGAAAVVRTATAPTATRVAARTTVRTVAAASVARTTKASRSTVRTAIAPGRVGTKAYSKWFAQGYMASTYRWSSDAQFQCLVSLWTRESGWSQTSHNRNGAHGIPQALPGRKMAKAGPNWQSNPETQIKWGLGYIKSRYGSPCGAWSHFRGHGWY